MPSKRRRDRPQQPAAAPPPAPSRRWLWAGVAAAVATLALIGVLAATAGGQRRPAALLNPQPVNACQRLPRFAAAQGFRNASFATDDRATLGLRMIDTDNPERVFQHPSWRSAGYLGPLVADSLGNLYVAPVPRISLIENPPGQQNRIYRVDSDTGEMRLFAELPAAAPPSAENVYGVLGLAIDCDTGSLYASSIAGSTRAAEQGRIFQLDLSSGAVRAQYEGVDAMGLGVFQTARGRRLYFGPARAPEVRSVALDAQGGFAGDERVELQLSAPGASGSDRALRIAFSAATEMRVSGRQFDYNLAATAQQPLLIYTYRYRLSDDGWDFASFAR